MIERSGDYIRISIDEINRYSELPDNASIYQVLLILINIYNSKYGLSVTKKSVGSSIYNNEGYIYIYLVPTKLKV